MNKFRHIFVILLLSVTSALSAQVVYTCDFESQQERQEWVLTNSDYQGNPCINKWHIGLLGDFSPTGFYGLFISRDGGITNSSAGSTLGSRVVAYRAMTLPQGTYNLDFDWRAQGDNTTTLYVYWAPQSQNMTSSSSALHNANWQTELAVLGGSRNWQPHRAQFTVDQTNTDGKLVFVWEATTQDTKAPAACVDNITITEYNACMAPTNLSYNPMSMTLSWQGAADEYEIRDYSSADDKLFDMGTVSGNSTKLNLTTEGTHYFYVRAKCGEGEYSQWVNITEFVWIRGMRCIDFFAIGDTANSVGLCYMGDFNSFTGAGQVGQPPVVGMRDYGPQNILSMHTLHIDKNEVDPFTKVNGGLHTVPENEIASIRLGAKNYGSGRDDRSARIEYRYPVQAGMSDLLDLKYAIVMNQGGHSVKENPSFTLEILDSRGNRLQGCTSEDFVVGFGETSAWHWEGDTTAWCDWDSLSISLHSYIGQTLIIRLTATRCTVNTHYSYGYFVLKCRNGGLDGLSCGDYSTDHFTAPEGFDYRWYRENDPAKATIPVGGPGSTKPYVSEDGLTLDIETTDANLYVVECHNKLHPECYYELVANPNPRDVNANAKYSLRSGDCSNTVTFNNTSYTSIINRETGQPMPGGENLTECTVDFGDGSPVTTYGITQFKHNYPNTGGSFPVTISVGINDGMCTDDTTFIVEVPDILHTGDVTTNHLCCGQSFTLPFNNQVLRSDVDTLYLDSVMQANAYGCMAPFYYETYFHRILRDTTYGHICERGYFEFEGERYYEPIFTSKDYTSVWGCDSVHYLSLTMTPILEVDIPKTIVVCGDDSTLHIPYERLKGDLDSVTVNFDKALQEQGFLPAYTFAADEDIVIALPHDSVLPNMYHVTLDWHTPECPVDPIPVNVELRYPSSILEDCRGFISLLNEHYNGGEYEWLSYQWYRNDQPVEGETNSYILVTDRDLGAEYSVVITRKGDNVSASSCPIIYTAGTSALTPVVSVLPVWPTWVRGGEQLRVTTTDAIAVYDAVGRLCYTVAASAGLEQQYIPAPSTAGVYVIRSGRRSVRIVVHD